MMKEKFLKIYREKITREGADQLLEWLEKSDFFNAPASTTHHLARQGGLLEHSVHVYERLKKLYMENLTATDKPWLSDEEEETIAICGLLHDVCKVNYYSVEMRNRKNEFGRWEQYPFYVVRDQLPYGHGEKSVYIVSGFMKLTREEAMAIRWHMGGFDDSVRGGSYAMNGALEKYPLALLTHVADMMATHLDERGE